MKLEKIKLNGIEYYQWIKIATQEPFINEAGNIFREWTDIEMERAKLLEMSKTN